MKHLTSANAIVVSLTGSQVLAWNTTKRAHLIRKREFPPTGPAEFVEQAAANDLQLGNTAKLPVACRVRSRSSLSARSYQTAEQASNSCQNCLAESDLRTCSTARSFGAGETHHCKETQMGPGQFVHPFTVDIILDVGGAVAKQSLLDIYRQAE